MKIYQKIICAMAALCLLGAALAGVFKIDAQASSDMHSYDIVKIMNPVWEGETSYMESVLVVENEYGGIDPIQLLYPIEEIVEVKNAELSKTYQKGVDYTVAGGKLIIADDGDIPVLSYEEFHPTTGQEGFQDKAGGYICFHEGDFFHKRQIVVTYTHTAEYEGYVPEGKGNLLPKVTEKLQNGEDLDLLVFGDSISVGANSSGFVGVAPYMPTYPKLFANHLQLVYGNKVNLVNPSVGGKGVEWGISEIDGVLQKCKNIDLAVIAFGMNDGNMAPAAFAEKTEYLAGKIQEKFPDVEIMLVATMLPNPDAKSFDRNQAKFHDALVEMVEEEGVAVVNVTDVHASLLQRKRYADMTGNNVNHTNDYMARVYAQTLFATLQEKAETKEETPLPSTSTNEGEKQQYASIFGLLSGCNGTANLAVGGAALGAAAIALKKKKDD